MKTNKKKIAIIGAGFFGCTIALILSKRFRVDLYEKKNDILNGASLCNQFRFHLGYHYPRSLKTVNEIKKSNNDFIKFYGKDVFGSTKNYYGVVKNGSKTTFKRYIHFLKKNNLLFKKFKKQNFTSSKVEGVLLTKEKILNYFKIKKKIKEKIKLSAVNLKLNCQFRKNDLKFYNKVLITSYQNNNNILEDLGQKISKKFRYELVEKIAIKLPFKYKKISFVILDGKFVCVDPYLGTDLHLLSHVKHSKLEIIKSKFPNFKKRNLLLIKKGKKKNIKTSQFNKFIKYGSDYLPFLKYAKYIFSYYVIRTIKNNVESTDERTNFRNEINKKILTILSGKWNTCVFEAKKINKLLK